MKIIGGGDEFVILINKEELSFVKTCINYYALRAGDYAERLGLLAAGQRAHAIISQVQIYGWSDSNTLFRPPGSFENEQSLVNKIKTMESTILVALFKSMTKFCSNRAKNDEFLLELYDNPL